MARSDRRSVVAPIQLFIGDGAVIDELARKAIDRLLPPERQSVDLDVVRQPERSLLDAVACFDQVGMFAAGRCVWIRGLANETGEEAEALLAFLDRGLPEGCSLVVTAARIDQRSRLYKWFDANAEITSAKIESDRSGRLKEDQVVGFVRKRIAANGLAVPAPTVLAAIAQRAGTVVGELAQEIDKLCLAASDAGDISEDLVRTHVRDQAQAWVYDLTNAISSRRLDQAQPLVERLLAQGEPPLRLLATLASHVGDLIEAAGALASVPRSALQGSPGGFAKSAYPRLPQAFRARFKSGFRAYYVLRGASAFRPTELRRLHRDLVELDLKLKSSSIAPTHLFAAFVQAACGARARAAQLS